MEKIEVSIGARIDELMTGFTEAQQGIAKSVQQIATSVEKSMESVEASIKEAVGHMERLGREGEEAGGRAAGGLGKIGSLISGPLGNVLGAFSLQRIIGEITEFADTAERLQNVAQVSGIAASQLSRLHVVADAMGVGADSLDTGLKKLAKSMSDAARGGEEQQKAFAAVNVSVEDLKNLSPDQILNKVADKFHDTEDGATKTALAMALFGKSGADLIPILNQGSTELTKMGEEAAATGAALDDTAIAAGANLDAALDKLGMQAKGLKNTFAAALAPAVQFVAECFDDSSGTAMDFGSVFKIVATIVVGVTSTIKAAWTVVSSIVAGVATALISITDATIKAASMDFAGAKQALMNGKDQIVGVFSDMNKNLGDLQNKTRESIAGIWSETAKQPAALPEPEAPKGQLNFAAQGDGGAKERAAAAKEAAEAAKKAAREKFDYELEILRNEFDAAQKGSDDRLRIAQQMADKVKEQFGAESAEYAKAQRQQVQIAEEVENEKRRIKDVAITAARDHAEVEIQLERGKYDQMLAMGEINGVKRAQLERKTEEELYAMHLAFLEQRLQLMAKEPQEVERIQAEIARLKGEHQLQMQQLDTQLFEQSKTQWGGYFQTITDGFANTVQSMIFQGITWQEAMGNILQNITAQVIQAGVKWVTSHITNETAKTAATVAGASVRTTTEVAAATTTKAANAQTATQSITNSGASVFGKVYDSIAGIPYVGPFLAPVMAVAAMAGVMGMVGKVASAENGWERVTHDGAMTELHKDEMVLPAPLAEGIRAMIESGNGRGQQAGPVIHALDRRDVQRYFDDNGDMITGALYRHQNNNPGGF